MIQLLALMLLAVAVIDEGAEGRGSVKKATAVPFLLWEGICKPSLEVLFGKEHSDSLEVGDNIAVSVWGGR